MNIAEFKAAYPAYKDIPDLELASALHSKYYSAVPWGDFQDQVGINRDKGEPSPSVSDPMGTGASEIMAADRSVGNAGRGSANDPRRLDLPKESATSGPMSTGASEIMDVAKPNRTSVLEDYVPEDGYDEQQLINDSNLPRTQARVDGIVARQQAKVDGKNAKKQAIYEADQKNVSLQPIIDPVSGIQLGESMQPNLDPNLPTRSAGDYAGDTGAAALKIGPTALKTIAQIYSMGSAGLVGEGTSRLMDKGMDAINKQFGSSASADERKKLDELLKDPEVNASELAGYLASHPMLMADMGITTVGSMFVPAGAVGIVGKLSKVPVSSRAATEITNVVNAAMNSADTFDQTNSDLNNKYLAAGIAALGSYAVGRATGGGIEGQIARQMTGNKAVAGLKQVPKEMLKEPVQEYFENTSQAIGQDIGEGKDIDWKGANKQGIVGAMVAPLVSGPATIRNAVQPDNNTPNGAAADALSRQLESGQFRPYEPANLNPNLTREPPKTETVAAPIMAAPSVDDAIKVATGIVGASLNAKSTKDQAIDNIAAILGEDAPSISRVNEPTIPQPTVAAEPTDPAQTWFGRRGDGYQSQNDAGLALPGRVKANPELDWKIEQMPNGRFRLAGYEGQSNVGTSPAVPSVPAESIGGRGIESAPSVAPNVGVGSVDQSPVEPGNAAVEPVGQSVPSSSGVESVNQPEGVAAAKQGLVDTKQRLGEVVSTYTGRFGKGMGFDAAKLEAQRLNKANDGITYTAEEHGRPDLENPWAVVGRKPIPSIKGVSASGAARITRDTEAPQGTIIVDGEGREYRIHSKRHDTIIAHPIVDGKPQVNRDSTVRFWTNPDPELTPPGDNDRRDPVFIKTDARLIPVSQRQPAQVADVAESKVADDHIGVGGQSIAQGGKPFKTNVEAKAYQKLQPHLRIIKSPKGKGFVLIQKTPAQLAAQAKAARRMGSANVVPAGEPVHAHGFIAAAGGLSKSVMSDAGFDKNVRVGNRYLFARNGGLTLEQATQKLIQDGYLPDGASHSQALDLIRRSINSPQYTADGWERIAAAESQTRFEDHLAAQQEAAQNDDFDPFESSPDLAADPFEVEGYDEAADPIKVEVAALIQAANELGIDTESLLEDAAKATQNESEQAYYEYARQSIKDAIAKGAGSSSDAANQGKDSQQGRENAVDGSDRVDGQDSGPQGNQGKQGSNNVSGIQGSDQSIAPASEKPLEAGQTEIEEATVLQYKTPYLKKLLADGLDPTDGFEMHLLANALKDARKYNKMMVDHNGDFSGIEFHSEADPKYPNIPTKYAFVLPDASQPGKWRISYFDKNGFSHHDSEPTQEAAQIALATGRYTIEDRGALDRLSATKEWAKGTAVADLIMRLNMGNITHAQFIEAREKLDADESQKPQAQGNARSEEGLGRAEFTHNGTRIYPVKLAGRDGAPPSDRWAVESSDNKARRESGDRNRGGDTLHATIQEAKKAADFEAKQDQQKNARLEEIAAREKAEKDAADAKREANKGKSLTEIKAQGYMAQLIKDGKTGEEITRSEWVKRLIDGGAKPSIEMIDKIKPLSRSAFNRASNQEQAAHEKKIREGGKVPEYAIGNYIVSKTEYDFAQSLGQEGLKAPKETDALRMGLGDFTANNAEKLASMPGGSWVLLDARRADYENPQFNVVFSWGNGKWSSGDSMPSPKDAFNLARKRWTDRGNDAANFRMADKGAFLSGVQGPDLLSSPTKADVLKQQADAEAEAKRKEEGGDKPLPRRELRGDVPDMFDTQGSVFDQPAKAEPSSETPSTYINGDRAEYTGKTETVAGALFYEVKFTEGAKKGQTSVTARAPNGANPLQSGPVASAGIVTPQLSGDPEKFIKVAADSIKELRKADVDRVLAETPQSFKGEVADYIRSNRKDLAQEVDEVMAEQAQPDNILPVGKSKEDLQLIAAGKYLSQLTNGSGNIYALSGRSNIDQRVKLMAMLLGKEKVNQADAGVTAIRDEFYKRANIDTSTTPRNAEIAFEKWVESLSVTSQPDPAAQATEILNAANVTGKERIDVLKDVKAGTITPEELKDAYPAKEPAKIDDVGEKIGGARKDRWKERGLDLNDLDSMSESEGAELATKANVWKPDYEAMSEASEPVTAAMVKTVYDQLAAQPKVNTPEGRRNYVTMMQAVRKVYLEAKSPDDVKNAGQKIKASIGLYSADPTEKAKAREILFSVYKGRSDPFILSYNELSKAKKLVEDGFPAKGEPWKRRLSIRAYGGGGLTPKGIELALKDSAEIGTPLTTDQIVSGFYRILDKDGRLMGYAPTKADAEAAAKTIYERDLKSKESEKPEPKRPHLDNLKRENLSQRIDRDVTADDFVKDFGFRGIEFGNWAAQDERQRIINMAYDGLMDLAEIMGVPPKAMSLNGTLGMAFGARGGGKFAAHYEPGKLVINMTKLQGGGSMAHEFAHALDHYFGELNKADAYTTAARGASGWYTEDAYKGVPRTRMEKIEGKWANVTKMRLDNLRPEMAVAFDNVMSALFSGQETKAEMIRAEELRIERNQTLADRETDPETKAVYLRGVESLKKNLEELRKDPEDKMYPKGRSKYASQAQALSGKSTNGYWTRPTEMFARAFESWVFDRVVAMGAKSDYLVHGVEEDRFAGGGYKGNPYPTGEERAAINAAFDKLVDTLETKETDKGVAMFSRGSQSEKSSVLSKNGKFKGWPKFNSWNRAEYNDVVSLLPQEYRNDPHRLEPLSPADRNARTTSALPDLEKLNEGLPKSGFGVDQLGNITVDARDVGWLRIEEATKVADKHGLGIYVTGVRKEQIQPLKDAGFTSELGLGLVLLREANKRSDGTEANSQPMPFPDNVYGNPAYGTIMSYKPRGFSQVLFSRATPFYSALSKEVSNIKANAQSPMGWMANIKGLVSSGKVKADEVEWSGVNDWLAMQQGKVTKEQVAEFLDGNGVRVTETVLGGDAPKFESARDRILAAGYEIEADDYFGITLTRNGEEVNREDMTAEQQNDLETLEEGNEADAPLETGSAKYGQYQLPGGTNYREVLLTLPEKSETPLYDALAKKYGRQGSALKQVATVEELAAVAKEASGLNVAGQKGYKSNHWDQTNVLAHIRLNDRTDADGNRVLFVEELQSDWGQQGKKEGFKTEPSPKEFTAKDVGGGWWRVERNGEAQGKFEASSADDAIAQRIRQIGSGSGVPNAPFVTHTDKWLTLALKRIMVMAAQEGYDKVAFVNGEQSADRYDLSKHIASVQYLDNSSGGVGKPSLDGPIGRGILIARDHNDKKVIDRHISDPSEIENYVGKEVAAKLFQQSPRVTRSAGIGFRQHDLSGVDLKVGGEGMKAFYDKIVPAAVNTLLKKVGGGALETVDLADAKTSAFTGEPTGEFEITHEGQPGFTITDSLRDTVSAGMPLFKRGENESSGLTPTQFTQALADAFGSKVADRLQSKGVVIPLATQQNLPAHVVPFLRQGDIVYGFYDPKTDRTYAVLENLTPSMVKGVALHEVGVHFGFKEMLGDAKYASVMNRLDVMHKMGSKTVIEARVSATKNSVRPSQIPEETLAYLVQTNPEMGLIKEVIARIKAFLFREFGIGEKYLNENDLTMLARAAVMHAGRLEAGGGGVPVFNRGTNDSMTNKDVVGKEKANPADDKTKGANKAVDSNGNPVTVYHGTPRTFDKFDARSISSGMYGEGFYFTNLKDDAELYSEGGLVIPATLTITNPASREVAEAVAQRVGEDDYAGIRQELERMGYDGVIAKGTAGGEVIYVAFKPEQINANESTAPDSDGATSFSRSIAGQTEAPRENSPWRDATGRIHFAPGQWLYDAMGEQVGPLLDRLLLKSPSPELSRIMRRMKLDVQRAQEVSVAVAKETSKFTDAEKEMVSDIIEKELAAGTIPPEHAVRLAAMINSAMGKQTDELIKLGMLSRESAEKWRDKYLPRYYESKLKDKAEDVWGSALRLLRRDASPLKGIKGKHLRGRGLYETIPESQLNDYMTMGWEVRDPGYTPGIPTTDGNVQVWRDFTRQERDKMGEIRDVGFRFVMGYMATQKDIALGRMFETLASDPNQSSRFETEKFPVRVPNGDAPGTEVKTYGKLAGRWVSRETMSQLSAVEESHSETYQLYRKAMGVWKEGKTVLNPVSHANNIISNLTMAHFAGVSYHRADKYLGAMRDFATKSGRILEAKDAGLFLGTLSETELFNTLPEELKVLAKKQDGSWDKVGRTAMNLLSFYLRKPMGWAYQAEDTFFRYLIYKDARERGLSPDESVEYAQKYIFTYDDLPQGARRIRDYGIPFFAYTYKAIPALLHTALTHPDRFAAPAAVLMAANAIAYALAGGDDDDWDVKLKRYLNDPAYREKARAQEKLERELLPDWNRGLTSLGTPKVIRLGTDELTKLPLFIDVSRIIPGGDLLDVAPNAGGIGGIPQPLTPSHPIFTTAVAMIGNKDLYFGKEITDSNDTTAEKIAKRSDWLWKQLTPAIAVNNYHWERGMNALAQAVGGDLTYVPDFLGGDATGIGRDGLPVQPKYAGMQTFGIKVRPFDFDTAEQIQQGVKNKMIHDIDAEIRKLQRLEAKGAVNERTLDKARDLANVKKERLKEGLTVNGDER